MNRRRVLNGVHRSMARQTAQAVQPMSDVPFERLSIADLDRVGPKLVTTRPVERAICIYCTAAPASAAHFPYCSTTCSIHAENS